MPASCGALRATVAGRDLLQRRSALRAAVPGRDLLQRRSALSAAVPGRDLRQRHSAPGPLRASPVLTTMSMAYTSLGSNS